MHDAAAAQAPNRKLPPESLTRIRAGVPTLAEASLSIASALLLVLSFPDFDLWWLAWAGLVVGRDLFLWHLLVAHLPDNPLCPYYGAARIRPVATSGHIRRSVPGSILCRARAHRSSLWSRSLVRRAAALG